jgi:hypothetical protein
MGGSVPHYPTGVRVDDDTTVELAGVFSRLKNELLELARARATTT